MDRKKRKAPWIVILGAGSGGLSAAKELDGYLTDNPNSLLVVLVDKKSALTVKTSHQFALAGRSKSEDITTAYTELNFKHVYFVQDEIISINTKTQTVYGRGHKFRYNRLIVALGAVCNHEKIAGLSKAAYNISKLDNVMQLKDALADFPGGNILLSQCSTNVPGPTAIYTYALLISSILKSKMKITKVIVTTPAATTWPESQPEPLKAILDEYNVEFRPGLQPHFVDVKNRSVIMKNGEKIKYDVLIAQFPYKAPDVLEDSKLCEPGRFVPTNFYTLKTHTPNVYCIGDCTEMNIPNFDYPVPKLAELAAMQGETVADDIEKDHAAGALLSDVWSPSKGERLHDGDSGFFVEVGNNRALRIACNLSKNEEAKDLRGLISVEPFDEEQDGKGDGRSEMRELIQWWTNSIKDYFGEEAASTAAAGKQ